VRTALSTQEAALSMRIKLLEYQRDFFKNALSEAKQDQRKAFVVGEKFDKARLLKFIEMIRRQDIRVYELAKPLALNGKDFQPENAFLIPLEQPQYKLILGIFQKETAFTDSIFYDISAWTMPLAFNLDYETLTTKSFSENLLGKEVNTVEMSEGKVTGSATDYAYLFEWDEFYAPAALYSLLNDKLLVKVATKPFSLQAGGKVRNFSYGTIVVSTQNQPLQGQALFQSLEKAARAGKVNIVGVQTGLTPTGIDLGSNEMETLKLPNVLLLVGDGVNPNDAGEIWHLLDTRYQVTVTKVDNGSITPAMLNRFNVVIMPSGNYTRLNVDALRNWLAEGGTLIAFESAVKWLQERQLANIDFKKNKEEPLTAVRKPYGGAAEDFGALEMPGAIFEAELDLTHPVCYGFRKSKMPVFRTSNDFMEPAQSAYAMPLAYTQKPLMAGYFHKKFEALAPGSAGVIVSAQGNGQVICFADNANFRAFWYGTNKLLANAVFFGNTISKQTMEKPRKK
jgi:hypothetical protein